MKYLKKGLAALLSLVMLVQCSPIGYSEGSGEFTQEIDGIRHIYHEDGTVTAVFRPDRPALVVREQADIEETELAQLPAVETSGDAPGAKSDDEPKSSEDGQVEQENLTQIVVEEEKEDDLPKEDEEPVKQPSEQTDGQKLSEPGDGAEGNAPATPGQPDNDAPKSEDVKEDALKELPEEQTGNTVKSATLFYPAYPESVYALGDTAIIHEVALYTYVTGVRGGPIYSMYGITADWDADTVSCTALPACAEDAVQTRNITGEGWVEWDVTAALSPCLTSGTKGNAHGLLLRSQDLTGELSLAAEGELAEYYAVTYTPLDRADGYDLHVQAQMYSRGDEQGTGYIELSWEPVDWAEGYAVGLFDGQEYLYFELGKTTQWSTENKGLWPHLEEVEDGRIPIKRDGSGFELPLDPASYYAAAGAAVEEANRYRLCVVPIGKGGQRPEPGSEICVGFEHEHAEERKNDSASDSADKSKRVSVGAQNLPLKIASSCVNGHDWIFKRRTKEPTCTEAGRDQLQCTRCGQLGSSDVPALGHSIDYSHWVSSTAATCTEDSYVWYKCIRCSYTTPDLLTPAYGHSYQYTYLPVNRNMHSVSGRCVRCGATTATAYEAHTDANGDKVCEKCGFAFYPDPAEAHLRVEAFGNGTNSGTGYLELVWDAVSEATGYYIAIFNGEVYEYIQVGNVTSWSTKDKGLWPTQEEIDAGTYRLHTEGGGAELPMIPAFSYANAGSGHAGDLNYYVSVIPYGSHGHAPQPPTNAVKTARLPDTMPPSQAVSVSVVPSGYTNANEVSVSWAGITDFNAQDGSAVASLGTGGVEYRLDEQENWSETGATAGNGTIVTDVSGLEDGIHVVYVRGRDSAGNTGASKSQYIYIDRTPPTAPELSIVPEGWNKNDTANLSWSGISDANELDRVEYAFDDGEYQSSGVSEKSYVNYELPLSALEDGEHVLRVRAVDVAGNLGAPTERTVKRDTKAPTTESVTFSPEGWTNGNSVELAWTGLTDEYSGVEAVWYSFDSGEKIALPMDTDYFGSVDITALADGAHDLLLCMEDEAGNRADHPFRVYRDVTMPELELLSPTDGSPANGVVEIWGSVRDLTLERWEVTAVGEDGEEHELASGTEETDSERMAVLNCAGYADGERVELRIRAWDKAGNSRALAGTCIVVDKSAKPIAGSVSVTTPESGAKITKPSITAEYQTDFESAEQEGLLYIDGLYVGDCTGGSFPFGAIRYPEGSLHSISVLSRAEDGSVRFSRGLAYRVLLSDAFEDDSCLASAEDVTLGDGARAGGGSGTLVSQTVSPEYEVLALRLTVTEELSNGGAIAYFYSLDGGESWTALTPGADIPLYARPDGISVKAELSGGAVLCGWTLEGVIETSPVRVSVRLVRPVESLDPSTATVKKAITALAPVPEGAVWQRMLVDGTVQGDSFLYDARDCAEGESRQVTLLAETEAGVFCGTGARTAVVLREENTKAGSVTSEALTADGEIYALRLEALTEGEVSFFCSTDGSRWEPLTPGEYFCFESPAKKVWLHANAEAGALLAWHAEGVTCAESAVTARIMEAPTKVTATDWGRAYYRDLAQMYYELSWTDPMEADNSAAYTTEYEIYRNGALLAVTAEPRYTDNEYVDGASYAVRTLRRYTGYAARASERSAATVITMQSSATVRTVRYTAEEEQQSEYLDKLYGGDYTFSTEPRLPDGNEILWRALLGQVDLCSYGLEPINFNTGNFLLETTDGSWADAGEAALSLDRSYNTQSRTADGPFGEKWNTPLGEHLRLYGDGSVMYCAADGAEIAFPRQNGVYTGGEAQGLRLKTTGTEYLVIERSGVTHAFTGAGLLKYWQYADGSRVSLERDGNGLPTAAVLPSGKRLRIETDENGHITAIVTPGGGTLRYEYEGERLVRFTDADGGETRYVYDGLGRMTEWYDAAGARQVSNRYDELGRVIAQTDANGGEYAVEYFDDHTVTVDAEGNRSEIWFDAQKRTTKTVDASGATVTYDYDQNSNIIAITDALGNVTRYEYDAAGNKTKETAPDGSSYSLRYDANNKLTQLTDQRGNVTRYEYDAKNRLVKQINPDGGELGYTYNDLGQVLTITDPMGNVTEYEYEGANAVRSVDPRGNETRYAWDAEGRLTAATDALGNTTQFAYDGQGNLLSVTFADGTSFAYEYDKVGSLVSQTDAEGNVTRYEYDALRQLVKTTYPDGSESTTAYDHSGNLVSTVDALGGETTAAYDGRGNLLARTDALGNTTSYTYDLNGRLLSETLANGAKTQYRYTQSGQLSSVTNAAGEQTFYTYDAAGNLTSVTAPDGGVTKYGYDAMGLRLTETAPDGAVTSYAYDAAGRLVTKTDALGNVTRYAYDPNGNLLTATDALGGETRYRYDALNRAVSMTDANGATTTYSYDAAGNLISQTDALGNVTEYAYDGNGSITELTDALGGKSAMRYDELGNVIAVLQKNGGKTGAEYDPLGRLLSETDALGNTTAYAYDANGKVTTITDALGQSAEIAYDAAGNVTRIASPDGSETRYAYDAAGRLVSETSAAGTETTYRYDRAGRLERTTVNGNETRYAYDLVGNIVSVTDAEGRKLELRYDALGNLTAVLYPDGTQDTYEYDALSRLVLYTPRLGDATAYTYDAMGDVLTVTTGGQTTTYEYDLLGRMTATVTADGARTEAAYDALGNTVKTVDALGNATGYAYTVDSLLKEIRYANGAALTASYDLVGNLVNETDPEGNATAYAYDPLGRMTAVTDALGNVTRYAYDAADRLARVTDALGHETIYTYDALGNLTSETDALGNTVKYSYTPEGWLETVTDANGVVTRYSYDKTGNILTADYAGEQTETNTYNELGLLTTVTTAEGDTLYQYDEASRLISVTQPNGETVRYTYDSHGNRATMTYPNGKTATYTYDDMNRLVSVKGIDGETTRYEYDALGRRIAADGAKEDTTYAYDEVGNLVSQTTTGAYELALRYAYDLSGRMTQESRTENGATLESVFTYDPLGQLTNFTRSDGQSESYTYDPAGNMLTKSQNGIETHMTYNAANQLIQSVSGTDKTAYSYDANGNLVKSENAGGARSYTYNALGLLSRFTREDGYTESYTYNANRLLSEIRTSDNLTTALTWDILYGDGVVISENRNGEQTSYTYGLERISALSGSNRTEYVYDGRGSVAAEVSYNNAWYTLGGGLGKKAVNAKSYTPFGEQIGEATSGFGYNGEYYNAATGMIYLRARFYEPEMNRFSQKDILRGSVSQPGSLNRYLYCQNDPVNFMDPSGMRQVTGIYGDGTGRTAAQPKQTTPIITKPSQNANASIPVKNRTAPVQMTDTGTGSYTSSNNAAKNATRAVSNNAINGYKGNANTPTSSGTSIAPSTVRPDVDIQTALSRSCAGSRKVTQVGNQIVYNGKIYNIPSGSPVVNWTPEMVEEFFDPVSIPQNNFVFLESIVERPDIHIRGIAISGVGGLGAGAKVQVAFVYADEEHFGLLFTGGLGGGFGASAGISPINIEGKKSIYDLTEETRYVMSGSVGPVSAELDDDLNTSVSFFGLPISGNGNLGNSEFGFEFHATAERSYYLDLPHIADVIGKELSYYLW